MIEYKGVGTIEALRKWWIDNDKPKKIEFDYKLWEQIESTIDPSTVRNSTGLPTDEFEGVVIYRHM